MPQITNYSVNASVLDSEFVSIWPEYIIWFKSHMLRNDAPVSVTCAERKWIHLSWRNSYKLNLLRVLDTQRDISLPIVPSADSTKW